MMAEANVDAKSSWHEANQRYLALELDGIRAALDRHAARGRSEAKSAKADGSDVPDKSVKREPVRLDPPPAIDTLCAAFRLSSFERNVVLLCAGMELDARFPAACSAAQGDEQRPYPTFSLALAALPDAHWSALTPSSPLRRYRLIEPGDASALTLGPLRIDERILHFLCGINMIDERLAALVDPAPRDEELAPSHASLVKEVAAAWAQSVQVGGGRPAAIQLCGPDAYGKRTIASAACASFGLGLAIVAADALPLQQADLEPVLRLWEREAILNRWALMVDCDELDRTDSLRSAAVTRLVERLSGVVILSTKDRRSAPQRTMLTLDVKKPEADEQRALWMRSLGEAGKGLNGTLEELGAQFDVSARTIRAAALEARALVTSKGDAGKEVLGNGDAGARRDGERMSRGAEKKESPSHPPGLPPSPGIAEAVWDACRVQARPRLDDLAQRIESPAAWDDLVLPPQQKQILRDIAAHVRRRSTVYEKWGFAERGQRGLGISALFAGTSGTGKTMAAEVIANDLRLDLYRIDLSATVSKYIGETEKNLSRVFDAAEEGGAVLLFDEADALFGKRSEVKDSHDRYANIEVSYLLQRMESYRGLAILTTNLKSALDTAFLRRIRFVVQFPFPDAAHRAEIWRRIFPSATPTDGLDAERLAQLTVSGGNIRNTALNAAFIAADLGEPVGMRHVLRAAQAEYAKLEKTLTEAETAGWMDSGGDRE